MEKKVWMKKTDAVYVQYRMLKFAFILIMIGQIGMGFGVYKAIGYKTVVIVPPNLEKEAEFVNGVPSDSYVRTIAQDIVYLAFNYTPATSRFQFDSLLRYVGPEEYAAESNRWYELANKIEASRVSSTMPLNASIKINPAKGEIEVTGTRTQYTNDRIIESVNKSYIIEYKVRRGQFNLVGIKEGGRVR